jgi:hypothetical protein
LAWRIGELVGSATCSFPVYLLAIGTGEEQSSKYQNLDHQNLGFDVSNELAIIFVAEICYGKIADA